MKRNIITSVAVVLMATFISLTWMSLRYPVVVPKGSKTSLDTVKTRPVCVSGKRVLFIGDSHTANPKGWQDRLCKKTGMTYKNVSVGGKSTPWMVQQAVTHVNSTYNFCFIYGGANDVCGKVPPQKVLKNVKRMIALCKEKGVTPIVIAGFEPEKCVSKTSACGPGYPQRYTTYQKMLQDSLTVPVIKFTNVSKTDCWDEICHMAPSGHEKASEDVIKALNLTKHKK